MKVVNSFLLVEFYNQTFLKKAHNYECQPWKGQPTSLGNLNFTLVIVSNLHHVPWMQNKTCEEKQEATLVAKVSTS